MLKWSEKQKIVYTNLRSPGSKKGEVTSCCWHLAFLDPAFHFSVCLRHQLAVPILIQSRICGTMLVWLVGERRILQARASRENQQQCHFIKAVMIHQMYNKTLLWTYYILWASPMQTTVGINIKSLFISMVKILVWFYGWNFNQSSCNYGDISFWSHFKICVLIHIKTELVNYSFINNLVLIISIQPYVAGSLNGLRQCEWKLLFWFLSSSVWGLNGPNTGLIFESSACHEIMREWNPAVLKHHLLFWKLRTVNEILL